MVVMAMKGADRICHTPTISNASHVPHLLQDIQGPEDGSSPHLNSLCLQIAQQFIGGEVPRVGHDVLYQGASLDSD